MNFNEAVKVHSEWKMKLAIYLRKPDGSLKAAEVVQDGRCALGAWIHAEGAAHKALPEFRALQAEHMAFHKSAADVITRADKGEAVAEELMLGASSDYARASSNVVAAIMALKQKLR